MAAVGSESAEREGEDRLSGKQFRSQPQEMMRKQSSSHGQPPATTIHQSLVPPKKPDWKRTSSFSGASKQESSPAATLQRPPSDLHQATSVSSTSSLKQDPPLLPPRDLQSTPEKEASTPPPKPFYSPKSRSSSVSTSTSINSSSSPNLLQPQPSQTQSRNHSQIPSSSTLSSERSVGPPKPVMKPPPISSISTASTHSTLVISSNQSTRYQQSSAAPIEKIVSPRSSAGAKSYPRAQQHYEQALPKTEPKDDAARAANNLIQSSTTSEKDWHNFLGKLCKPFRTKIKITFRRVNVHKNALLALFAAMIEFSTHYKAIVFQSCRLNAAACRAFGSSLIITLITFKLVNCDVEEQASLPKQVKLIRKISPQTKESPRRIQEVVREIIIPTPIPEENPVREKTSIETQTTASLAGSRFPSTINQSLLRSSQLKNKEMVISAPILVSSSSKSVLVSSPLASKVSTSEIGIKNTSSQTPTTRSPHVSQRSQSVSSIPTPPIPANPPPPIPQIPTPIPQIPTPPIPAIPPPPIPISATPQPPSESRSPTPVPIPPPEAPPDPSQQLLSPRPGKREVNQLVNFLASVLEKDIESSEPDKGKKRRPGSLSRTSPIPLTVTQTESMTNLPLQPSSNALTSSNPLSPRLSLTASSKELSQLELVCLELLRTERDYVNDIDALITVFIVPLRTSEIISEESIAKIFSNTEQILEVNMKLLDMLEEEPRVGNSASTPPSPQSIAQAFLAFSEQLKLYSVYCSNQHYSMETLRLCRQSYGSVFEGFLQRCRAAPKCKNLDLMSFLIKPIQRICKYPLLLREIVKLCEDEEQRKQMEQARAAVEEVVAQINEEKRRYDRQQRLEAIKVGLGDQTEADAKLLEQSKKLLYEGTVQLLAAEGSKHKSAKSMHFFLLDNLFILCKRNIKKDVFKVCHLVPLQNAIVNTTDGLSSFEIGRAGHAKLLLAAETSDHKTLLLQKIAHYTGKLNWLNQTGIVKVASKTKKQSQLQTFDDWFRNHTKKSKAPIPVHPSEQGVIEGVFLQKGLKITYEAND